jgi:hypothetical protein
MAAPLVTIVIYVVVEVIPMLVVLDWSFMEMFVSRRDSISTIHFGQNISDLGSSMKSYDFHENVQKGPGYIPLMESQL